MLSSAFREFHSLRGRRLKGKGQGVLGARETRGARVKTPFPFPFKRLPRRRAIKAFKKGVLYHGEDCNREPENDPPILEPAFLLVNR